MIMSDNLSGLPATQRKNTLDGKQQSTISARASQFCYILVCLHIFFFNYIGTVHSMIYLSLVKEDFWVENLTFASFLLAGVILFAAALAERRLLPRYAYVLSGIALLFFAAEEISWGQRIIGFETPDFLADSNSQGEFNIHNLYSTGVVFSKFPVVALTLGIVACAAFFCRKDRIFGLPSPPILLTLSFLSTMSYTYYGTEYFPDLWKLIKSDHRGLLLLLLVFALLQRNGRLFITVAATLALALATAYLSSHTGLPRLWEAREYLFSLCCFFYALHVLLAQRAARQKIASSVAAFKSAAALPSIRIKSPAGITGNYVRGRFLTSWTSVCAVIIAGSIGLVLTGHLEYLSDIAAFRKTYSLSQSNEPNARSNFDVYLVENELHYFKQPCDSADVVANFFLGVFPQNVDDLPVGLRQYGFANLDYEFAVGADGYILDGACAVAVRLPTYEIASVSTGQYTWDADGALTNLWIAEFPVNEHRADAAAFQETELLTRTVEPAARSNFDVYLVENELHYFKQPCDSADVVANFFLGVFPQNVDDLPVERRPHGFENLDFDFEVDAGGSILDGACAAKVKLPGYEIARVSTGQYTWDADGALTNLWIAEFPVNK